MFKLEYITPPKPEEIKKIIKAKKEPNGLGPFTDANGTKWNIRAIIRLDGKLNVYAVKYSNLHPYYTNTSSFGYYGSVSQTWNEYEIEIVNES